MLLAEGTRLGPYELLAPIGSGGMGEVYKARDTRLNRIVAIKVSQAQFSERFEREARAIAAFNHPHICQIYDVGPNYLVMEFVEGAALKGPLPLEKAVEYATQILDALDAAHRKGITHRDLKPANILVTRQGIKLLDFGLARIAAEADATMTIANAVMGTPAYMAPEQWEGKPADARSDIYAFGCVLHEMLTGKLAAKERTRIEPAVLESVVQTCLEKDPEDRWQSARDIKRALSLPAATAVESRRGPWIPIAAAMLVLGGLGGGWAVSHFRPTPTDERSFRLQIDPPEGGRFIFGASTGGGIALSPDGRTAAFMASGNGRNGLWVRSLDSTTARLLPGTEGASYPFWSPDNKSIAFFTTGKLERVDLAGGSPLAICDVAPQGRGGAWSSDGQILFGTVASGLFQVSASGGTPSPLTTLDASRCEASHRWPQMLPGRRFLYFVWSDKPEITGIYAASLSKPSERVRLLAADTNAVYAPPNNGKSFLLWLRGGMLFAQEFDASTFKLAGEPHPVLDPVAENLSGQMNVAVSVSGLLLYSDSNTSSQFTWLDRAGKSLGVVGEPGEYEAFRLSPDGRRAAVARDRSRGSDLWLLEVQRGVFSRFTSNSSVVNYPIWSPDGRTIVYQHPGRAPVLFRKDSDGAGSEQRITQSQDLQDSTDWSRDGRFVLYYEVAPRTQRDLWILPVSPDGRPAPGTEPKPYLRTPFNESWGRFSPEASPRWIAYQSDESGRYEIYIQAFPEPRGATRISTGGGQYPQWGPDGRELFYVSPDYKLMVVSLKLKAESVQPSAPRELFPLPVDDIGFSPYEVAPDGQRFLVRVTSQQAAEPLTVIVNWPALLKK